MTIPGQSTRPGWIRIWVPENAKPGPYEGTLTIRGNDQVLQELKIILEVSSHTLPAPDAWNFHLDLWQNPYAAARYYDVELWSKEHFDVMRQDMKHYADAGGDVITASITHKPWNGQTYDYFETMVTWMKKADGTWYFDYTIFDRWVEFMMEMGVTKQINCYSMIPWRLSFQYYDQATNQLRFIETRPGEFAYEDLWVTMLTSFADHLKEKGWFDKTFIAMDERPMEAMMETLKAIRKADKDFKVSLAGNLHPELIQDIDDYSISYGQTFTAEMKKSAGLPARYLHIIPVVHTPTPTRLPSVLRPKANGWPGMQRVKIWMDSSAGLTTVGYWNHYWTVDSQRGLQAIPILHIKVAAVLSEWNDWWQASINMKKYKS